MEHLSNLAGPAPDKNCSLELGLTEILFKLRLVVCMNLLRKMNIVERNYKSLTQVRIVLHKFREIQKYSIISSI